MKVKHSRCDLVRGDVPMRVIAEVPIEFRARSARISELGLETEIGDARPLQLGSQRLEERGLFAPVAGAEDHEGGPSLRNFPVPP